MSEYIAVQHTWFIHTMAWRVRKLQASDDESAIVEAALWNTASISPTVHSSTVVVRLSDGVMLDCSTSVATCKPKVVRPMRRLTLWERLRGYL